MMDEKIILKILELQLYHTNFIKRFFLKKHYRYIESLVKTMDNTTDIPRQIKMYIIDLAMKNVLHGSFFFPFEKNWLELVCELFKLLEAKES